MQNGEPACLVCSQVQGEVAVPGGPVYEDELVVAFHTPPLEQPRVYLGHLLVVPRRHVAGLDGLSDDEAALLGMTAARLARALKRSEGAEHVYSSVVGHGADHLHVHVFPRYPGTPKEYWFTRVDDWPEAPLGDFEAAAAAAARIRASLHS